jgi:putative DeoR family transcriptional regulator (stage III sporulation protein D)
LHIFREKAFRRKQALDISKKERAVILGEYIAENGATVRAAALKFDISKSTVHKDVTEKLGRIDTRLASRVREVLDKNKAERHMRGGEATKQKYKINK